jgi:hypothetical protein
MKQGLLLQMKRNKSLGRNKAYETREFGEVEMIDKPIG